MRILFGDAPFECDNAIGNSVLKQYRFTVFDRMFPAFGEP